MERPDLLGHLLTNIRTTSAPDVVYHYTSPAGLMGILGDAVIQATDVQYLNDAQEFEYTLELARQSLASLRSRGATSDDARLLDQCNLALGVAPNIRIYAASFSKEGNLLSQWRAYCPPTGGFSIGITSTVLESAARTVLLPCVYDRARQDWLFGEIVGSLLNDWRARPAAEAEPETAIRLTGYGATFLTAVLLLAAVFKDPSFKEEEEWRLTTRSTHPEPKPLLFREGRSGLVPYEHFTLRPKDGPLRIDRVIVGPNPHPTLATRAVLSYMEKKGVVHDGVVASGIPYRTW